MSDPRPRREHAPDDPAERLWLLWQGGKRPSLDAFLAGAGPLTAAQLVAVLRVDQQQRWQAGEGIPAEAYLRIYPGISAEPENAVLLIYGEYLLREGLGQAPDPAEYLRRFPAHAAALRLQFELHRALDEEKGASSSGEGVPQDPGLPVVPGYELLEVLGRGATSVVYTAFQQESRRLVALKRARDDLRVGEGGRARFRAEAEAVARVQHPNVVRILDVGEHRGRPFLALDYVDGGNLAGRLREGPLAAAEAARLVEVLARAVDHVHRAGIIHRDINPANVLLQTAAKPPDPPHTVCVRGVPFVPRITDFGLAKLLAGGVGLTGTGAVLGTPGYMAPEQADGRAKAVGPAADVHALGAVLYHLLTGRPPYDEGGLVPTLLKVRSGELPPGVRDLRPEVPPALEAVCHRCLSKRPEDRYPTAADLAADLEHQAVPAQQENSAVYLETAVGKRLFLSRAATVLGRSADCDVRLHGRTVSRHHCRITVGPGGAVVADLGSTGGTRVNGRRVEQAPLREGDRLGVGGEEFRVRFAPGDTAG